MCLSQSRKVTYISSIPACQVNTELLPVPEEAFSLPIHWVFLRGIWTILGFPLRQKKTNPKNSPRTETPFLGSPAHGAQARNF